MSGERASWTADVFDRVYEASSDPWDFEHSPYEHAKYAATIAALGGRHFASCVEVGCSIGVLTRQLARHSDALLALDVSEAALARARIACAALDHVRFARMQVPGAWPDGRFDLIVLSEVLYFLGPADIALAARRARESLLPGGVVLLVNWVGETNTPCSGDEAAELFMSNASPSLAVGGGERAAEYRLDLLVAPHGSPEALPYCGE